MMKRWLISLKTAALHSKIPFALSKSKGEWDFGMLTKCVSLWKPSMLRLTQHERLPQTPASVYWIIGLIVFSTQVFAVDVYQLPDPEQQKTYESLTSQLRCLVCQNQTIADSNAELAGDLRRQVFEMLQQGKSKEDIVQFMTDRYGDFVLYNPPFKGKTSLLWAGPVTFLIIGFAVVFWFIRQKRKVEKAVLDVARKEKIRHLLENEDQT
jgi:cytochrome c-type biogenesis protein CcmH